MIDAEPLAVAVDALRSGETTPLDYLDRLRDRIDRHESDVRAFVPEPEWDRLEREARALPERFPDPDSRPPLYGTPVGVKDIFHVEGMKTRAGSELPPEVLSGPEARSVERVRAAGGLVLGKTVTTEFAYFDPGPTRNPHDLAHTPGGSSSGSAAAVAAGFAPLAFGTQTVGSVIRPAAFCGVVGLKPSFGRIPTTGVIPFSTSVDHVGLFTGDVAGMGVAAAVCYDDWRTLPEPEDPVLGVPEGSYLGQADDVGLDAFEAAVERLAAAGYDIERVEALSGIDGINERHQRLIEADAALVHHEWYEGYGERYSEHMTGIVDGGRKVSVGELADDRAGRDRLRSELHAAMDEAGIDCWLSPPAPGPAPEGIDSTGDPVMNLPWTHSGLPTVTVPAGEREGLPVGLQCSARFGADERLLAWAEGFEGAL
ncbi:amidase [Natronorarus salvus]|uniref:amidase n=1 Tax=Natronorarus salvus TaxID=3117733 RepID=UPI002F25F359